MNGYTNSISRRLIAAAVLRSPLGPGYGRMPPLLALLVIAGHAAAQDETNPLVAREVVVLLVDRFGDTANAPDMFGSTFSAGASTQRPRDPEAGAIPGGFITFSGGASTLKPFDILVELQGGKFMAGWPRQDQRRDDRLLWQDLRSDAAADVQPPTLPNDHWMSPLRSDTRRLLQRGNTAERLLFYDASVEYSTEVTVVSHGGERTFVKPVDGAKFGDILLIQPAGEGLWTTRVLPSTRKPAAAPFGPGGSLSAGHSQRARGGCRRRRGGAPGADRCDPARRVAAGRGRPGHR